MATHSMLQEQTRRAQWMDAFREYCRRYATDPAYRPAWPDVRSLYEAGYHAEQAARKHLSSLHLYP